MKTFFSYIQSAVFVIPLAVTAPLGLAAQSNNGTDAAQKGALAEEMDKTKAKPTERIGVRLVDRKPASPAPVRPRALPPQPATRAPVRKVHTHVVPPPEVLAAKKLPSHPVNTAPAPLGLTRLKSTIKPAKFDVDSLELPAGASGLRKGQQSGASYLAIDGTREWSRPLRGSPQDVLFVSFVVNAGLGTSIDVGGAQLRVSESHREGHAEIHVAALDSERTLQWRQLGYRVRLESFGGRPLAALPLLTVRLDPGAGVWDIYSGLRPISRGLPLTGDIGNGGRKLAIQAGENGAWICGAVVSEENPLFADADSDGIDDTRAEERRPTRLPGTSTAQDRKRPPMSPPVLRIPRPVPDRFLSSAAAPKK